MNERITLKKKELLRCLLNQVWISFKLCKFRHSALIKILINFHVSSRIYFLLYRVECISSLHFLVHTIRVPWKSLVKYLSNLSYCHTAFNKKKFSAYNPSFLPPSFDCLVKQSSAPRTTRCRGYKNSRYRVRPCPHKTDSGALNSLVMP